jgi:hypothetical protein
MSFRYLSALAGAVLSLSIASAPASAATNIHTICRGGPVVIRGSSEDSGADAMYGAYKLFFTMKRFRGAKSDIRSDGSHLAPGECSWSAGIIPASWGTEFEYDTRVEALLWDMTIDGTDDSTSPIVTHGEMGQNPAFASDLVLQLLPMSARDDWRGTIMDPARVVHLYVQRIDGRLVIKYRKIL